MGKQASQGSTNESQQRSPNNQQRGQFSTLNRMLLGQMVNPPDTAISTPLQQSISNLQGGYGQMRQNYGLAGGLADQLAGKLDGQDAGEVKRGRKLSDSGAKARFFHEVSEAHLARIVKVDLKSDLFTYDIDVQAQQRAELMDGKLLLVTNGYVP